jgi:phospholipid/cholesterol/gamma-HCH transport system substrate-binding protein
MLINITHGHPAEHRRLAVAGVAYIATIALLIGLSIAVYAKAFTTSTTVTIKADRAGLQLAKFGDVRINGALVGQVRSVSQDGEHASIVVALDPDSAKEIPDNVSVQILPTTLFGQKFIQFVRPAQPSSQPLEDGSVIPADRVNTNVELSQVLADLFPLLRAIRPADLAATLNALATALDGRGERLGVTFDKLHSYLGAVATDLPTLRKDLVALADVADTYDKAAPDVIDTLRNLTVTSRTIVDQKEQLASFIGELTGLAGTTTDFLNANGAAIVRTGQLTEPIVRLLATYSPEFPCLLTGLAKYRYRLLGIFEGGVVKQRLELGTPQYRVYDKRDRPVYGEVGHGPWCLGLPNPKEPSDPVTLDEGSQLDEHPPTSPVPGRSSRGVSSGYAGSEGDQAIINALLASRSGHAVDSYGSLPALMYGPVVRGGGR